MRALFLVAALGVLSLATLAWAEPGTQVLARNGLGYCPSPPIARGVAPVRVDHDLLLFVYGLSQGGRS